MNNFDAMNRQYPIPKMKEGTYPFARNIILTDKYTSVMNEPGAKHIDTIPGLTIGEIVTSSHIVYFSTDLIYSYIGYRRLSGEDTSYKNIIKSKYFNFQIDCPIEGIFYYNYKNELIVGWCDGTFENSNPPYLINLDDLPFEVNGENELINPKDISKANWFTYSIEPTYEINYGNGGNIVADSMHFTMSYCLEDGTELRWFPIDEMAYPKVGFENVEYRAVYLNLLNLDINFEYYKIAFVINTGGASTAYKSDVLKIRNYAKESHTLDSLSSFFEISVEDLVIPNLSVSKVNTMTIENNQVFFGGYITPESEDDNLQKYINLLDIGIRGVSLHKDNNRSDIPINIEYKFNHPSLLPNEVYSFKIKAKRLDGTYTDSFQISNKYINNTNTLTTDDLQEVGLIDYKDEGFKHFQIFNNASIEERLDFFNHVFKAGTYLSEETYPDIDDFNSLDIGGEDLRGKPINYHRMPDSRLIAIANNKGELLNISPLNDYPYHLYPFVKNLDLIPDNIKDKYQSFTLEIVKRNKSNSIVQDTGLFLKTYIVETAVGSSRYSNLSLYSYVNKNVPTSKYKGFYGSSSYLSYNIISKRMSLSIGSLIKSYGVYNLSPLYSEYFKNLDETLPNVYKVAQEAYFLPYTALTINNYSFGILKNYKYYEENRATNSTRFAENQLNLDIDSSVSLNTEGIVNYYNPINVSYVFSTGSFPVQDGGDASIVLPFDSLPIRVIDDKSYRLAVQNAWNNAGLGNNGKIYYNNPYYGGSTMFALVGDILNIKNTIYKLNENNLITIGKININNSTKFLIGGDVFTNTEIEVLKSRINTGTEIQRFPIEISRLYSTSNNAKLYVNQDSFRYTDRDLTTSMYGLYLTNKEASLNVLNTVNMKIEAMTSIEGDCSRLNDLVASTSIEESRDKFINKFPYRIAKSIIIQKESLTSRNIRVFKADSYYDMPNDKGIIVALRSTSRKLFIQQKYSLFISEINATMNTNSDETVYLGQSLFLEYTPLELMQNDNLGYIGCQSKFACKVFRDGLIVIDMLQGKIFIIKDSIKEVSSQLMRSYYKDNLKINLQNARYNKLGLDAIDNPFIGIGFNVTFDNEYERIIFTKQEYILKNNVDITNYNFNGEVYIAKDNSHVLEFNDTNYINKSETFSIATETLGTVSNHDYFPNSYNFTNNGLFYNKQNKTLLNTKVFSMNSHDIEVGNHDGKIVESYIDIPFNKRLDLSKLYQALYWVTEVVDKNNVYYQEETLSKILLYNYNQCSGLVDLDINRMTITRNAEGIWQFNEFRDLVKDVNLPIIHNDGEFNESNINNNKYYFNKSNFIGIFIVARLYFKNGTMNTTYLHNVNVKSIISKR